MSSKAYRPGRCALCRKYEDHPIHNVVKPLKWWQKLARLAWPRWMWRANKGDGTMQPHHHTPDSYDRAVAASESMNIMRRRYMNGRR